MSEPTIDCGPCILRAWRAADLDPLVRFADNPKIARGLRDRFPSPFTRADGEAWLALMATERTDWRFAVEVDGLACGGLGFHPGEDVHRIAAELGYWLGEPFWGRGILAAALRAVVPRAMERFGLERVWAGVYANNPGSMRALEKGGFAREGLQHRAVIKHGEVLDLVVYARLRSAS